MSYLTESPARDVYGTEEDSYNNQYSELWSPERNGNLLIKKKKSRINIIFACNPLRFSYIKNVQYYYYRTKFS